MCLLFVVYIIDPWLNSKNNNNTCRHEELMNHIELYNQKKKNTKWENYKLLFFFEANANNK
jgi:hypothetical protein